MVLVWLLLLKSPKVLEGLMRSVATRWGRMASWTRAKRAGKLGFRTRFVTHPHPPWPPPSPHNHPQALIRMWRTLHRTRSGASVCYALVYPRGRMAGGQDLAGHCTTLSSPHGSLLWTFTWMARLWKTVTKSVQRQKPHRVHQVWMLLLLLLFFFRLPPLSLQKAELKARWVRPALQGWTCYQTGTTNGPCHWEIQFGVVKYYFDWVVLSLVYSVTFM